MQERVEGMLVVVARGADRDRVAREVAALLRDLADKRMVEL